MIEFYKYKTDSDPRKICVSIDSTDINDIRAAFYDFLAALGFQVQNDSSYSDEATAALEQFEYEVDDAEIRAMYKSLTKEKK